MAGGQTKRDLNTDSFNEIILQLVLHLSLTEDDLGKEFIIFLSFIIKEEMYIYICLRRQNPAVYHFHYI